MKKKTLTKILKIAILAILGICINFFVFPHIKIKFFFILSVIFVVATLVFRWWISHLLQNQPKLRLSLIIFTDVMMVGTILTILFREVVYEHLPLPFLALIYCWTSIILGTFAFAVIALFFYKIFCHKFNFSKHHLHQIFLVVLLLITLVTIGSYINARLPIIREISYTFASEKMGEMKVVAISDLHAGLFTQASWLNNIITQINAQNPDLILLIGDSIDREKYNDEITQELAKLKAKYGVYAVLGNHEIYFGDFERVNKIFKDANINLLVDDVAEINGEITLIGRNDFVSKSFFKKERESVENLLKKVKNRNLPTILLDHNPNDKELAKAIENKITLQLSGHTHAGQIVPFNFFVNALYKNPYGEMREDETIIFTSCGVGIWGPPLRNTSRPEILVFNLRFEKKMENGK